MEKYIGLSDIQVKEKLKEFGFNEIREVNKVSPLQILFRQVKKNFVVYLLTITALIAFFLGKDITAYVIAMVIAIVVSTGFVQEYKAEKAISALRKMIMPVSLVIRDRKEREVPSREIVVGDIVILRTGEKIPADCLVLDESSLKTNESILTGESAEVGKSAVIDTSEISDENQVFMGTFVVAGKAIVEVQKTGMETKFGQIAGMISTAEKHLPLQDKVNSISKYMAVVGLTAAFLTGIVLFVRAETITAEVVVGILIIIIALAVSSFPEGFPVVLTTTLAAGVNRMAKQNAVVNRMSIIETLGETSVICSDKTGTLTKGEMTVKKIYSFQKEYEVGGIGYEAKGDITLVGEEAKQDKSNKLEMLVKTAVLCNDSNIERVGDDAFYRVIGSPTEGALLVLAAKAKMFKEDFSYSRVEEMPFDSNRKMMSTLYKEGGKYIVYAKGAPEVILSKCSFLQTDKGIEKLSLRKRREVSKANKEMTSQTLRTLALAYKVNTKKSKNYSEEDLVFLGLVGMEDPPREEVAEAISLCQRSGIKVKMITGDNPETAVSIAAQIGIEGKMLTGSGIEKLTDRQLTKKVRVVSIFSRVKPEHKLRIVKALKRNREIVTMTGDGVNDAPALKEAHIGVAMGINGTDVSRSVADITLKDDNFATIVNAIKEGRTIFNNIRKFVTYQLSCNLSDIVVLFIGMILAPFLGWLVPIITALQILFMNIVTDNMPAITLGFNPTSKDIMNEKPRKNANILTFEFIRLIVINGSFMGLIALFITWFTFNILEMPTKEAQSTVLVSMILMQIANAFNFRSFRFRVLNRGIFVNKYLLFASSASVLVTLAILYTPLQTMFETTPIGITSWFIALFAVASIITFFDLLKTVNNKTEFLLEK